MRDVTTANVDPYFPTHDTPSGPHSTYKIGQSSRMANMDPYYRPPLLILPRHDSERMDLIEAHKEKLQSQMRDVIKYLNLAGENIGELDRIREKDGKIIQQIQEIIARQEAAFERFRAKTTEALRSLRDRSSYMEDLTKDLGKRVLDLEDPGSPVTEEESDTPPTSPH